MIKKLVAISLIISILATLFRVAIPIAWYVTYYDYIKTELCINRHIPGSDCNGSCQLKKKVHEQHDDDEAESPKTLERAPRVILFVSEVATLNTRYADSTQPFYTFQNQAISLFLLEPSTPPPQFG